MICTELKYTIWQVLTNAYSCVLHIPKKILRAHFQHPRKPLVPFPSQSPPSRRSHYCDFFSPLISSMEWLSF